MPTEAEQQPEEFPTQCFLGWDAPILELVVERLLSEHRDGASWDLRKLTVVLPSSLAKRRLAELLSFRAEQDNLVLFPPNIQTIGTLPEHLYVAKYPFASQLIQHVAWMQALQSTTKKQLKTLIPAPPQNSDSIQWLELAKAVSSIHRELASDRKDFRDVAEHLRGHVEFARWDVLADIQRRYLLSLDELKLWDIQTARCFALDHQEPQQRQQASPKLNEQPIIVVGCVDLNETQRGFLSAVASRVQVWIAAPDSEASLFDQLGCLNYDAWQNQVVNLPSNNLYVGVTARDQAELTAGCLAELGDKYHARDITLGVPDQQIIPQLRHRLKLAGTDTRFGPGRTLSLSEPTQLLALIGNYLENRSYTSFAALIRHPAVCNLLARRRTPLPENWLAEVDDYYQEALPRRVDKFVNRKLKSSATYSTVTKAIDRWLSKISTRPQSIGDFVQPLLGVLSEAYDRVLCDAENPVEGPLLSSAQMLGDAILDLREVPGSMDCKLSASQLIQWLIGNLQGNRVPETPSTTSVEMLGWLELYLDDSPALIVTGLHDGVAPQSINADPFLPNRLRQELGMTDNARRFARDLYAFRVMVETRKDLRVVVGRTDLAGDPLTPSRLLMACDLEKLPSRVLHLSGEDNSDKLPPVDSSWASRALESSRLAVPKPTEGNVPRKVTVTAFRDFLDCPYRFYLRHVLKLRTNEDTASELDARSFGNLVHDTLAELKGPIAKSTDEHEIREFLLGHVREFAKQRYGVYPSAPVMIQIEQAETRLTAFARSQAERAAEGWEIKHVEVGSDEEDQVLIGSNEQLCLIGRIDRMDYHAETGRWAIWDYKTSDKATSPWNAHINKKKGWINLQLPLYRHIGKKFGITSEPIVGYINLPKDLKEIGFYEAKFTQEQLDEADQLADDVASQIAVRDFWPEKIESVKFDDYMRICQMRTRSVSAHIPSVKPHRTVESVPSSITPVILERAQELIDNPSVTSPTMEPLLIRASAGTGKTFQLSNRLLQILLAGKPIESILATTFTRKAAGEILQRVLERLACACEDENKRKEIEEHVEGVDTSLPNCLATLRRLTSSIHRLRIGTLDSFFAQVAKTFSFEMALPHGWKSLDPAQEPRFQMQAVSKTLDNEDHRTLLDLVRMLAKGDSGRRVAEEIRGTVNSGYAAYRVTDSDAWDQLPIPSAPSEKAIESALRTLETTRLNHKSADAHLEKLHLFASVGDWERVMSHGIMEKLSDPEPKYHRKALPSDLIIALEVIRERAASELLAIRKIQTQASHKVLAAYDSHYSAMIQQSRQLGFSDVTHYLSKWISDSAAQAEKNASTPVTGLHGNAQAQLEFRLDCGIEHLLLDEFQDTSADQWQILEPLAKQLVGHEDRSIFCVGDTKQAIYGWRGGVSEVFDAVLESLPSIKEQELRQSYRSSPTVINSVNNVFENLDRHDNWADCDPVAEKWSSEFPKHETARAELDGYVRLQNGPFYNRDLTADENRTESLHFTAKQIAELAQSSSASIGVLFRNNASVAEMIAILRELGVSASQDGGNPLTDSAAVELVLSLVHLADHPGDGACHYHVRTSPLAAKLPVDENNATEVSNWFRSQCYKLGLGRAIEYSAELLSNELSWWDQHRLEQLIQLAFQYEAVIGGRLSEFERIVESQKVALPSEAQVKVMTIHMSKGLEFDAVFLPDLKIELHSERGNSLVLRSPDPCKPPNGVLRYMNKHLQRILPQSWQDAFSLHKSKKVTESLCLLYVAMTRAKRALYMTTRPAEKGKTTQEFGSLLQKAIGEKEAKKEARATLYELGDPAWHQAIPAKRAEEESSVQTLPIRIRTDAESAPNRGLRIEAPSYVSQTYEPVPVSEAFSVSSTQGSIYGTIVHAFFEQIEWLDDFRVGREELRQVAMARVAPEELLKLSLDAVLDDFEEMLQLESVQLALSKNRYARARFGSKPTSVTVDNERILSLALDGKIVSGTIDRLAILYRDGQPYAAEIIDFKTDAYDEDMVLLWLEDRVDHHRAQLEAYAEAVAHIYGIPLSNISMELLMLSTDDLVEVKRSDEFPPPHFSSRPVATTPE